MLGIDKSNASRLVRQLRTKGQVAIATAADEDARLKHVRLTTKGVRVATGVDKASRRRFEELLSAIAPTQRRLVLDGLEHLNRALERPTERKRA